MSAANESSSAERIGRYEVIRKIATGGMAELFLAKQVGMEGFERVVAIKRILAHLAYDEEFINMFRDEARIVAKLSHPNVVQIFDLGKSGDSYFIAMEYIPGRNLASVAKRAKQWEEGLPPLYVARCMAQACEGLHYAHTRADIDGEPLGIVHRDVSPQNIIVSFSGGVKLVDFGIAKAATKIAHTRAGVLKGKYAYMSPEQIRGEPVDPRSDLFSAGIVLYELLTGRRPFEKENSIQTLKAIVQEQHRDCRELNPEIPDDIAAIIDRALAKTRDTRYQTAQELQLALEDAVATSGTRVNSLTISNWMKRLFEQELQPNGGATVVLKGLGEVVLPARAEEEASLEVSIASEADPGFSEEGTLDEEEPVSAAEVSHGDDPTQPPRHTSGRGRGHLIEEGVIGRASAPSLANGYLDDATELAADLIDDPPSTGARVFLDDPEPSVSLREFNDAEETMQGKSTADVVAAAEPELVSLQGTGTADILSDALVAVDADDDGDPWGDKTAADPSGSTDAVGQAVPEVLDVEDDELWLAAPPRQEPLLGDAYERPFEEPYQEPERSSDLDPVDPEDEPWGDKTAAEPMQADVDDGQLGPEILDETLPPSAGLSLEDFKGADSDFADTDGMPPAPGPATLLEFADDHETMMEVSDPSLAVPHEVEVEPEPLEHFDGGAPTDGELDLGLDEEAELPAAASAKRGLDLDGDGRTIAMAPEERDEMLGEDDGLDLGFGSSVEAPTDGGVEFLPIGDAPDSSDVSDGARRLAAIALEKRAVPGSGGLKEVSREHSRVELDLEDDEDHRDRRKAMRLDDSFDGGSEEMTLPSNSPRAPVQFSELQAPSASAMPNDDNLSRIDMDLEADLAFSVNNSLGSPADLFAAKAPVPMSPPDENAAIGSTKVPPANVSLSDLLTDENRSARGYGLGPSPGPSAGAMVEPAPGLATSAAPPPKKAPPAVRLSPGLRNIRETSRTNGGPPPEMSAAPMPGMPPAPMSAMPPMVAPGIPGVPMGPMGYDPAMMSMMGPQGSVQMAPPPSRAWVQWAVVGAIVLVLSAALGVGFLMLRGTRLTIETTPAGAAVAINGHPVPGVTPVTVKNLKAGGKYQVQVTLPGHEPILRIVPFPEDSRDARVRFNLTPAAAP